MKIVSGGEAEFHYEFTCEACRTQLEANVEDVRGGYEPNPSGGERVKGYHVQCPQCLTNHTLVTSDVPLLVQLKADARSVDGWK